MLPTNNCGNITRIRHRPICRVVIPQAGNLLLVDSAILRARKRRELVNTASSADIVHRRVISASMGLWLILQSRLGLLRRPQIRISRWVGQIRAGGMVRAIWFCFGPSNLGLGELLRNPSGLLRRRMVAHREPNWNKRSSGRRRDNRFLAISSRTNHPQYNPAVRDVYRLCHAAPLDPDLSRLRRNKQRGEKAERQIAFIRSWKHQRWSGWAM
jgi:hypothetical protein